MSDEIKHQINDLKREIRKATDMFYNAKSQFERIDALKREVGKTIDILRDTNSRLGRLEEDSKRELNSIEGTLKNIEAKLKNIEDKIDK